jgi:hypothetical protein
VIAKPYEDPAWQEELDRIAPPAGRLSYLSLYWEGGYDWEPIGRWMVAQIIPPASIAPAFRELLEGPNPADHGYFECDEYGQKRWVTTLPGITRRQWQWYRDFGSFFRPYFVVQGTKGGHRLRWTFPEKRIIEMNGGDPNPPAPGDLPYAVPDQRTFKMLGEWDMLRKWARAMDYMDGANARDEFKEEERRVMRAEYWKRLGDHVEAYSDELAHHIDLDDAPETRVDWEQKNEELEEAFITEGS